MPEQRVVQTRWGKPIYINTPLSDLRGGALVTDYYFGPQYNDRGHRTRWERCLGRVWRVLVSGDEWAIGEGMSMVHGEMQWKIVSGEDRDPDGLVGITIYERHDGYARAKVSLGSVGRGEDLTPRLRALFDQVLGCYALHEDQTDVTFGIRNNATAASRDVRWFPDRPLIVQ